MPKKPKSLPKKTRYQIWKERRQRLAARKMFEATLNAVIQWRWQLGEEVSRIYIAPQTLRWVWGSEGDPLPPKGYSGVVYQSNFGAHGVYAHPKVPADTFTLTLPR